jgi:hypothetical protein
MDAPVWQTSAGFLGTVTERTLSTFTLSAENANSFLVISGELPTGLTISNDGVISGITASIGGILRKQFVVRASNTTGITDRTFIIDVTGLSSLSWVTPGTENTSTNGFLQVGRGNEFYVINREYVDFQFEANLGEVEVGLSSPSPAKKSKIYVSTLTNVDMGQPGTWRIVSANGLQLGTTITGISTVFNPTYLGYGVSISLPTTSLVTGPITLYDPLPFGQEIVYYIESGAGQLPPGLTLNKHGKLYGYLMDNLGIDTRVSTGGYDSDQFSGYPYDHGTLVDGQYVTSLTKFVPKIYQFIVTAYNGVNTAKRTFKILVVDPSNLTTDINQSYASGPLSVESSYLVTPTWLKPVWFGFTSTIGIVY